MDSASSAAGTRKVDVVIRMRRSPLCSQLFDIPGAGRFVVPAAIIRTRGGVGVYS